MSTQKMKKKEEVCPLLIDGNCPHGGAGKECEYTHKRRCYGYLNFSTKEMHRGGCKFGDECRFLHPTLCKNSVGLNTCLNEYCQYAHLKNTHMKKTYEDKNNSNSYRKPNMRGNSSPYGGYSEMSKYSSCKVIIALQTTETNSSTQETKLRTEEARRKVNTTQLITERKATIKVAEVGITLTIKMKSYIRNKLI